MSSRHQAAVLLSPAVPSSAVPDGDVRVSHLTVAEHKDDDSGEHIGVNVQCPTPNRHHRPSLSIDESDNNKTTVPPPPPEKHSSSSSLTPQLNRAGSNLTSGDSAMSPMPDRVSSGSSSKKTGGGGEERAPSPKCWRVRTPYEFRTCHATAPQLRMLEDMSVLRGATCSADFFKELSGYCHKSYEEGLARAAAGAMK
eukprot:PhM_4_TR7074/c0_g1_i1/m.87805